MAGGEGSEEMADVVRWLRQEKDTKAQELHLSQQENARLRQDCTRYQREAAAAAAEVTGVAASHILSLLIAPKGARVWVGHAILHFDSA